MAIVTLCKVCRTPVPRNPRGRPRSFCDEHATRTRTPAREQVPPTMSTPSTPGHEIAAAALRGRFALLEALQQTIARQIDEGVPARDLASLSKRLVDISVELEELSAQEEDDDIDEAVRTPDEPWTPS